MNRSRLIFVLALLVAFPVSLPAVTYSRVLLDALHPPSLTRDCLFFTLGGVRVADPAVNSAWFAVPRTHPGFREIYELLRTAKPHLTSGAMVFTVATTGNSVCGGHAEVEYLFAQ